MDHGDEFEASLRKSALQAFPAASSSYKRLNRVIPRIFASTLLTGGTDLSEGSVFDPTSLLVQL